MAKLKASTDNTNLADIVGVILDKGIVIDLWVKLLLIGTEILRLEARIVVASVETYLTYAEAIGLTSLVAAPANAIAAPAAALAVPAHEHTVPAAREIAVHSSPDSPAVEFPTPATGELRRKP